MSLDSAPWTKAKTAREMMVGDRSLLYDEAVDWNKKTVDIDGAVYGEGVRTPTCRVWKTAKDRWLVMRQDLKSFSWTEKGTSNE